MSRGVTISEFGIRSTMDELKETTPSHYVSEFNITVSQDVTRITFGDRTLDGQRGSNLGTFTLPTAGALNLARVIQETFEKHRSQNSQVVPMPGTYAARN
jgi:hypothetical protein